MTKDEEQIAQIQESMDELQGKITMLRATGKAKDRVRADMLQDWRDDLRAKQAYFINHLEKTRREEET